jgi:hypothetical protein
MARGILDCDGCVTFVLRVELLVELLMVVVDWSALVVE